MELTMIDFLGQMINDQKARQQGYAASTRWLCTRQDIKDECKVEAERMFEQWKTDELKAKEDRENMIKDIPIKYYGE
jgi:hypothetical protein